MRLAPLLLAPTLILGCADPVVDTADAADTAAPGLAPFDEALAEDLADALADAFEDYAPPAMIAVVRLEGVEPWSGALGELDLSTGEEVRVDAAMRYASITKTVVAELALLLQEDGALSLDDPVSAWTDALPDGDTMTLRHLLLHTSGLPEYGNTRGFAEGGDKVWTDAELVALIAEQDRLFEPGDSWAYSNTNYVLMGMILEAASGQPWHALAQQRLFDPLGLETLRYPVDGWDHDGRVYVGGDDFTDVRHPSSASAAGGLVGDTLELARWGEAFGSGALISAESWEQQQGDPVELSQVYHYGLGMLIVGDDPDRWQRGHNGAYDGGVAWVAHREDLDATVAVTANAFLRDGMSYDYNYPIEVGERLWEVLEDAR